MSFSPTGMMMLWSCPRMLLSAIGVNFTLYGTSASREAKVRWKTVEVSPPRHQKKIENSVPLVNAVEIVASEIEMRIPHDVEPASIIPGGVLRCSSGFRERMMRRYLWRKRAHMPPGPHFSWSERHDTGR